MLLSGYLKFKQKMHAIWYKYSHLIGVSKKSKRDYKVDTNAIKFWWISVELKLLQMMKPDVTQLELIYAEVTCWSKLIKNKDYFDNYFDI